VKRLIAMLALAVACLAGCVPGARVVWAPDGSRASLDMGVKVPVVRLHTRLSPAS